VERYKYLNVGTTEASWDEGQVVRLYVIPQLSAIAAVEGWSGDYVCSLLDEDLSDIFGSGATPSACLEDLMTVLHDAKSHLRRDETNLSPRLKRQLTALNVLFELKHARTEATQAVQQETRAPSHSGGTTAWGDRGFANGGAFSTAYAQ
jgi:hypothetical protein